MEKALVELRDVLVDGTINIEGTIITDYETTTYRTNQKIKAVIQPANKGELQKCIVICNEHKIPVYPISRGRNWGYGSKVPVTDNSIVIDLSLLNRISDYNEELGYVTIEPGVTYQQLFDFLRSKKSELLLSTTGGSRESSLIGNTLERGIGTGLYAERLSSVCGFEVMLANGKTIGTGFRRFGNEVSSKIHRWGVGPYLDGLFTQSNLGIVTEMTMWLMPCPEHFQLIFYSVSDVNKFSLLIDEIQKMTMEGLIRPTVSIFNDYRVLSNLKQYPLGEKEAIDKLPLPERPAAIARAVQLGMELGKWTGEISIRGANKEHAQLQYELIKKNIEDKVDHMTLFEVSKAEMLHILNNSTTSHTTVDKSGENLIKHILIRKYIGIPEDNPVRQSYWRKTTAIPTDMDPDRDKCGLIWICPIVPFRSEYLNKAIRIFETTVEKYGFEPAISLQCMSERSINIIASIAWDREISGEDDKAIKCYEEAHNLLEQEGFYFYRETTHSMVVRETNDGYYSEFLKALKKAADTNNIISPGRYIKA